MWPDRGEYSLLIAHPAGGRPAGRPRQGAGGAERGGSGGARAARRLLLDAACRVREPPRPAGGLRPGLPRVLAQSRDFAEHDGAAAARHHAPGGDRKSVVQGKSVSVRVDPGCRRIITKKRKTTNSIYRSI